MKTYYDIDFKKELVKEYLDGKSLNNLYQNYGVAKSTIAFARGCSEFFSIV